VLRASLFSAFVAVLSWNHTVVTTSPQRTAWLYELAAVVTEEGSIMQITDPKLFKAIETALASGNTVYLIDPDCQSTGDGPELMRNSTLIKGRHGESPADAFHTVARINSYEC